MRSHVSPHSLSTKCPLFIAVTAPLTHARQRRGGRRPTPKRASATTAPRHWVCSHSRAPHSAPPATSTSVSSASPLRRSGYVTALSLRQCVCVCCGVGGHSVLAASEARLTPRVRSSNSCGRSLIQSARYAHTRRLRLFDGAQKCAAQLTEEEDLLCQIQGLIAKQKQVAQARLMHDTV